MWLTYKAHSPLLYNNNNNKWIGGNRDASQISIKQRVNQIGIRYPYMNYNVHFFNNNTDKNTVNNALSHVRAGGYMSPPIKSMSKISGPTRYPFGSHITPKYPLETRVKQTSKYPIGQLFRCIAKNRQTVQQK